ncbi:tRNA uridine-5-carboxymethylaminomethyl(34) synthesis GTPase MnmE [Sphingomonas oleivorans]|uniref:tRNA modification GTPase MnmE n=1 Tax=Sphingomonas oleivorans TaxID=1735121 RepID=A0A2T5G3A6_9SPHN|nr:tRNA uridine-5-carboxymethylaminomethyl(34) synthesis GTPase MnmE [Sphingomonas oleivorans]
MKRSAPGGFGDAGDTIFALSSGQPPAAVAIVRISGAAASDALAALAGRVPPPRRASLARLRDPADGALLDQALILWFPGPATATGEDLAELHLHGGRSVVAAVLAALGRLEGLRPAVAGEFTRRAFANGRIDLAEAEGLADLLAAETETQRRNALALAEGGLSRAVEGWRMRLLDASARIEAMLDFADEDDVREEEDMVRRTILDLAEELAGRLAQPPAERLRDGIRVVLAGSPNAGKSTLFNALVEREAAITSPIAGTTRDIIEAPVAIGGTAFLLIDTAGLREGEEEIERIGVDRARAALLSADILLWLDDPQACPDRGRAIIVHPRADEPGREGAPAGADISVSARSGMGMTRLGEMLRERAAALLPREDMVALNRRQREALAECVEALALLRGTEDMILWGEALRLARSALDRLTGRAGVEDMLDRLFGAFCIGK